ncbi:MAG: class I SAM-dependent methyltransferase [Anaerolineales bacterium]
MTNAATTTVDHEIRRQVREFYDSIGWRQIGDGLYQNARYEDLRPVSQEYIRRCHTRVMRHLPASGKLLLDAGSGPIQYPEYLEYSRDYERRVCLDISRLALVEARNRIGERGFYVVGDVSRLPFAADVFSGVVSLHTVHHVPTDRQGEAFEELHRVQHAGGRAVVVYSWGGHSLLMRIFRWPIWLAEKGIARRVGRRAEPQRSEEARALLQASGTFVHHHDQKWLRRELKRLPEHDIVVWRSVSTAFLRALVHRWAFGRTFLRLLYGVEEMAPHLMGRVGQYPMIVFGKDERGK